METSVKALIGSLVDKGLPLDRMGDYIKDLGMLMWDRPGRNAREYNPLMHDLGWTGIELDESTFDLIRQILMQSVEH